MQITLLTVPDERLRQKSEPVKEIDSYIRELAKEMLIQLDTPIEGIRTIGLSAPQFGEMVQLIVVRLQGIQITLANPEITKSTDRHIVIEGCRSIPGKQYRVERPKVVKVRGLGLDGKIRTVKGHDLLAAALCHEVDHCSGVMIDRIGDMVTNYRPSTKPRVKEE
jgi:peptide deformylase